MDLREHQGLGAEDPDEIIATLRSRQWEPDRAFRPWLLAALVVVGTLGALFLWLEPAERSTPANVQPGPGEERVQLPVTPTPTDRVALPPMRPDRSAPPPQVLPQSSSGVAIYECRQNGQRVLSDKPCGPDAAARVLDTRELNTFTEVAPPVATAPRASPGRVERPAVLPAQRPPVTAQSKEAQCEQIEAWKDRIDAAMRRGYTSRQGERLRAEWHRAKQAYYDAGCGKP